MADDDLYSLDTLARNQMTHYGPDPAAEEVGRRVRATGQNFYNTWFGPAERLGRLALTGTLDTSNPQAVQDAFNVATWATGGRMPFARAGTLGTGGGKITAYHGSPYDFEKFSSESIGTGEGAQSYGHGLYFAENKKVAESYRDAMEGTYESMDHQRAAEAMQRAKGDPQAAIRDLMQSAYNWGKILDAPDIARDMETSARLLQQGWRPPKGGVYEVNINAEPEHFLDWDKPISQQHPNVQRVLRELNMSPGPGVSAPELTGEQILTNMAVRRGMTHEQAAQALREAGIPGIRYLDQGSRFTEKASIERDIKTYQSWLARNDLTSAQRAEQNRLLTEAQKRLKDLPPETSNYVVFDDQLIDIIKKYGIAGLIAAGAYSHQDAGQ